MVHLTDAFIDNEKVFAFWSLGYETYIIELCILFYPIAMLIHDRKGLGIWIGRRFWESRQFYSSYIALFVAITNWITIQYRLVLEHVPVLGSVFSNILVFTGVAAVFFTVISILGGHYVHRKRQFRIEQSLATEENPYLYRATPGKERDLMIPVSILHLEVLEELLKCNNALTEEKKREFEIYIQALRKLMNGQSVGAFK